MSGTLNLTKAVAGQKVDLTKNNPGLKNLKVELGWKPNEAASSKSFDLDAFALCLNDQGKLEDVGNVCYFRNLTTLAGAVSHSGDNLTGEGDGADEVISVMLDAVPANIAKVLFAVNIYQAAEKNQNFGMVKETFVQVVDADTNQALVRFDPSEDASVFTGLRLASIYRHNGEWKFEAVSTDQAGYNGDINTLVGLHQ